MVHTFDKTIEHFAEPQNSKRFLVLSLRDRSLFIARAGSEDKWLGRENFTWAKVGQDMRQGQVLGKNVICCFKIYNPSQKNLFCQIVLP